MFDKCDRPPSRQNTEVWRYGTDNTAEGSAARLSASVGPRPQQEERGCARLSLRGLMRRVIAALGTALGLLCVASMAFADKVAVLPFTAPKGLSKPEIARARAWTQDAAAARGYVPPSDSEMVVAEMAVKDGVPDTSQEYIAAGRALGAQWTVTGQIERHDAPLAKLPDGSMAEGYTTYHVELEVAQVESGRVESLAREIDPDEAPAQIAEMLALLLRPEGIRNVQLPWDNDAPLSRKPKPNPAEPPPLPPPPPRSMVRYGYAENRFAALGLSTGFSSALVRPSEARGPSGAMSIGGVAAYAIERAPGFELRGVFTSQVVGPKAIELSAGVRYAIAVVPQHRIFLGPELLLGAHVALGADKTARVLGHGAAFVAWGIGEQLQLELAGDLATAFGGTGTLVLGGGTARALVRF